MILLLCTSWVWVFFLFQKLSVLAVFCLICDGKLLKTDKFYSYLFYQRNSLRVPHHKIYLMTCLRWGFKKKYHDRTIFISSKWIRKSLFSKYVYEDNLLNYAKNYILIVVLDSFGFFVQYFRLSWNIWY